MTTPEEIENFLKSVGRSQDSYVDIARLTTKPGNTEHIWQLESILRKDMADNSYLISTQGDEIYLSGQYRKGLPDIEFTDKRKLVMISSEESLYKEVAELTPSSSSSSSLPNPLSEQEADDILSKFGYGSNSLVFVARPLESNIVNQQNSCLYNLFKVARKNMMDRSFLVGRDDEENLYLTGIYCKNLPDIQFKDPVRLTCAMDGSINNPDIKLYLGPKITC